MAAADFDVGLITPTALCSAPGTGGTDDRGASGDEAARDEFEMEAATPALQDFGNWWDYVRAIRRC